MKRRDGEAEVREGRDAVLPVLKNGERGRKKEECGQPGEAGRGQGNRVCPRASRRNAALPRP